MPEAVIPAYVHTGLFVIKFPWMKIKDEWLSFTVEPSAEIAKPSIGEKSEIPTAGYRYVLASQPYGRKWHFYQSVRKPEREPFIRVPIRVVPITVMKRRWKHT